MSTRTHQHRDRHARDPRRSPPLDLVPGVPRKVSIALDALGEPHLTAIDVRTALDVYLRVVSLSRAELTHEHNDWTEFVIPHERGVLERAVDALPARHAALLWRVVSAADEQLRSKTLNNPRADRPQPWWARLWWH